MSEPVFAAPENRRAGLVLFAVLLALAVWRLLAANHAGLELYADEAQYWTWSLQPDWGYYSKPPMVAWAIWLGTHLFGDGELGVRAVTVLVYPLTAWLLYRLARRLFRTDPRAEAIGFWAGVTYATLPMVSLGSWLITTDAFLILFWSLSLYILTFALESERWRDWLLLGLTIGLGLMSKYSMVFFGLGLAVYLAVTPERRRWFLNPRPYAAAAIALLVLAPNILWNSAHQFVSYQHTAEISQLDKQLINPGALLEFFGGQFAVFGPIAFVGLLWLTVRAKSWFADDRLRFLAAFSLVPLAAFFGLALMSRAFANWAAFSYAAGACLVAAWWLLAGKRRWLIAAVALNLAAAVVIYHAHDIANVLDIQFTRKTDPYARVTGYRALGEHVAARLQAAPEARLLSEDRKQFAWLRYYARPYSASARFLNPDGHVDNHYALTADVRQSPAGTFLLVSQHANETDLKTWFADVIPQAPIKLNLYPDYAPEYRVWLLKDYRGP